MRLALQGATTMTTDLSGDITAAAAAGFDGIEIWAAKLDRYLASRTIHDLRRELEDAGIAVLGISSIEHFTFRSGATWDAVAERCDYLALVAAAIGHPAIVAVPSPLPPGYDTDRVHRETVEALRDLSDIARRYDVPLAFEPLGVRDCSVRTLPDALRIVREVGRPDVGLVLDAFHFYTGSSPLSSIAELHPDELTIFHLDDCEDLPREQLTDAHRLMPGRGILPLRAIATELRRIGWDGIVSIELFRPEYWDQDPVKVARMAYASAQETVLPVLTP
jgi:2-keto-myo-inositol isomerase